METNILVKTDNLTNEEWLRWRQKGLGGSDIAPILGDYNTAQCMGHTISWKPVTTERLDSKALKEAEPDLYSKYVKTSTSRRFSVR